MDFLDNLLGKRIILSPEMKVMANKMIENNWFRNCSKTSDFNTIFDVKIINNMDEIENKLAFKKDVKGFATLDNLFIEASRRSQLFLSLYYKNQYGYTWNKLTNVIVKSYISNCKFNFDKIQDNFNSKIGIQTDLYLRRVFVETLREIYFKDFIENFPVFFSDVVDVYLKGNVIIGWLGKFDSHDVNVEEILPIHPNDGVLNIW